MAIRVDLAAQYLENLILPMLIVYRFRVGLDARPTSRPRSRIEHFSVEVEYEHEF
jgi:hypothetical protein